MKKLFPIFMALVGIGAGIGAGLALKKEPDELASECVPNLAGHEDEEIAILPSVEVSEDSDVYEYVKLSNQFIIPIVEGTKVKSLVVMALNLEVEVGYREAVFALEPKLRNAFLLVLFDHANAGGFQGAFTNSNNMVVLQNALREIARKTVGNSVSDVLITDVVRQDT